MRAIRRIAPEELGWPRGGSSWTRERAGRNTLGRFRGNDREIQQETRLPLNIQTAGDYGERIDLFVDGRFFEGGSYEDFLRVVSAMLLDAAVFPQVIVEDGERLPMNISLFSVCGPGVWGRVYPPPELQ